MKLLWFVFMFTISVLFDWFGISCMTTDNICSYLQKRLIQTSQTGGKQYSDTSPFSVPWSRVQIQPSLGAGLKRRKKIISIPFWHFRATFDDDELVDKSNKELSLELFSKSTKKNPFGGSISRHKCYKKFTTVIYEWNKLATVFPP